LIPRAEKPLSDNTGSAKAAYRRGREAGMRSGFTAGIARVALNKLVLLVPISALLLGAGGRERIALEFAETRSGVADTQRLTDQLWHQFETDRVAACELISTHRAELARQAGLQRYMIETHFPALLAEFQRVLGTCPEYIGAASQIDQLKRECAARGWAGCGSAGGGSEMIGFCFDVVQMREILLSEVVNRTIDAAAKLQTLSESCR
jgi:hypothetical protein